MVTNDSAMLLWLALSCLFLLIVICVLVIWLLGRRAPDPEPGLRMLAQQLAMQGSQQREFSAELSEAARANRVELAGSMRSLADSLEMQLERQREDNERKLESIRRTVDEQLQSTLETRLGESFRLVSEQLEQVQRGLGEMQALAGDVGDLKRVLTNVKTRGIWGEAQLASILEQMFTVAQYAENVEVVPGSNERVEFAIRLPGHHPEATVWLPVDAKFPREDYERLLAAQEAADKAGAEKAGKALETRLRQEARRIGQKYVAPPSTTDFAVLFLPVEGLFAELARRPGLLEGLHRDERIIVAGPTTLSAILSSLQMGFRTLAVEQRSSEIRRLLVTVKSEFSRFGEVLARTREQLEKAAGTIGTAETRTRALSRQLSEVESLPTTAQSGVGDISARATDLVAGTHGSKP
ncbi:MAG: DNA recombination protein RmuC [Burkholderiaceae bacterium]